MRVIIVGYGRMGREIESVLLERGHQVALRVDASGNGDALTLDTESLAAVGPAVDGPAVDGPAVDGPAVDGIIEFALPDGILDRIGFYTKKSIPAVVGTTGWNAKYEAAQKLVHDADSALLHGSNFSVGAHIFFRLSAAAAALINNVDEYDAALVEYHHNKKADYPSGTALTAANAVLAALDRKTHIVSKLPEGPIPPEALQVASLRVGSVPGVHELQMDSPADYISIRHEARSRRGFALGAVRGLEWLNKRKGWYEAETFIDDLLTGGNI